MGLFSGVSNGTRVLAVATLLSAISLAQTPQPVPNSPPEQVTLRMIVVSSLPEAEQILAQLRQGQDFATLAKQKSIDTTSDQGGLMEKVAPTMLRPELRDALQSLTPGQLSPVIRTPLGYAVLQLVERSQAVQNTGLAYVGNQASSAAGSVKLTYNVSGLAEAEQGMIRAAKDPNWDPDPWSVCEIRKQSLLSEKQRLQDFLSPRNKAAREARPAIDAMSAHISLAELNAYWGNMDRTIEQYQAARQIAESQVPAALNQMNEALGISYLHRSGIDNNAYRAPGEKCLLPMPAGNAYTKTANSEKAVEYFLKYLEQKPDELEVKWLLNLAYMTLGEYPDKVPPKYLIPPSVFQSAEDVGRFPDVAPFAGLDTFSMAGGIIVDDLENNGRLDVVKSSFDVCAPMQYFHNNGDGTFTDRAAKAGLADQLGGLNMIQADYNNDGCTDILVLRGGWEVAQHKSLLRNNCNGTFTDVTAGSGLSVPTATQAGVWVDINNDGLLDLFVGNEAGTGQLFLNNGDGTFKDISHAAGIDKFAFSKGVAAADYDNDGYADLFVSNLTGPNFLYHNNHDNTFTEVAESAGVQGPTRGFATWFFDYDNDGWPDLFVTSYPVSVEETARTYLGLPHNASTLKLYRNLHNGTFKDVTAEVGLDKVFMPMGANFGDIDNDGFLDIYLGTGNPSYGSLVPSVLLRNHDGKYFVDVTASSGTGELHKGHGVAFADLENNGNEDIIFEVGGATLGRQSRHARIRESWQRQRLDQPQAGRRKEQSFRYRYTNQSDRGKQGPGDALNLSHSRQRWLVRSITAATTRWPRQRCPHPGRGNLVAGQQHPAAFRQRGQRSVSRDQGARHGLCQTSPATGPAGWCAAE